MLRLAQLRSPFPPPRLSVRFTPRLDDQGLELLVKRACARRPPPKEEQMQVRGPLPSPLDLFGTKAAERFGWVQISS